MHNEGKKARVANNFNPIFGEETDGGKSPSNTAAGDKVQIKIDTKFGTKNDLFEVPIPVSKTKGG